MTKRNYKLSRLNNGNWQVDWGRNVPKLKDPRPGKKKLLARRSQFRSKGEAEEFLTEVFNEESHGPELTMSSEDRIDWASARNRLDAAGFSLPVSEVVANWITSQPNRRLRLRKAFKKYRKYKLGLIESGQRSERLKGDLHHTERALFPVFEEFLHEVTVKPDKLISHVEESWTNLVTQKKQFKHASTFFAWCIKRGWISKNPVYQFLADVRIQRDPHAYSIEEVERIMRVALETNQKLETLAFWTIAFFAGCRPSDIARLDWGNVFVDGEDAEEPYVLVPSRSTSKSRVPRRIPVSANVATWLSYCDRSKPIFPKGYPERRRKVLVAAKVGYDPDSSREEKRKHQDCPRHCYGTYLYSLTEDGNLVTTRMGNSVSVLLAHYVGAAVKKSVAESYFAIVPCPSVEKVVKFG